MSSTDNRQSSAPARNRLLSGAWQLSGQVSEMSPADQLSFPSFANTPAPQTTTTPLSHTQPLTPPQVEPVSEPVDMQQLLEYANIADARTTDTPTTPVNPAVTRQLTNVQTGMLPITVVRPNTPTTTALRQPVVIRGTGKKSTETLRPPRGRRWVVHIAVTGILALIVLASVLSVVPTGNGASSGFNPFRPIMNLVQSNGSNNAALIAQQAATATAVITHQDGFDPGQNSSPGTGAIPPVTSGSTLNRFAFGQCTYWANMRYHALTGHWVPWLGNADQWAGGASASGWVVSATPRVPSIIVLQPYVQGASGYGHVAVVERINSDGSVYTSNYNWYAGGGGWDTLSYWTFRPGPGVSFVWYP